MRSWLAEGRIGPDSLVWHEGWSDWREAHTVFPELAAEHWEAFGGPTDAQGPPGAVPEDSDIFTAPRRTTPRAHAIIIALLVAAVIVLFLVFLYVLFRPPAGAQASAKGLVPGGRLAISVAQSG